MTTVLDPDPILADVSSRVPGLVADLVDDLHGELSAQTVTDCLARCYAELHSHGVEAGLDDAARAMAWTRLRMLRTARPDALDGATVERAAD